MTRQFCKELIFILFLVITAHAQSNSWQGITPLRSTILDVEKRFGKPVESHPWASEYKTDKGTVRIVYSRGKCNEGWNVSVNTVLEISATEVKSQTAEELGLVQGKQFIKTTDDGGHHSWIDPVKGLRYDFGMGAREDRAAFVLEGIVYGPMRSDNELRCQGFPPYEPERYYFTMDRQTFVDPRLKVREARYSMIARIQNSITQAYDSKRGFRVYALVYFDKRRPFGFYVSQLKQLKKETYKFLKVSQEDLVFIEGGLRDEALIEYYLISRQEPPPTPEPTYPSPQFIKKPKNR